MTSFVALDGVTLFLRLKNATNTPKRMGHSLVLAGVLQCNGRKLKLKTSNVFHCLLCVRIEIDQP